MTFAEELRRLIKNAKADPSMTHPRTILKNYLEANASAIAALVEAASDPVAAEDRSLYIWQVQQALAQLSGGTK